MTDHLTGRPEELANLLRTETIRLAEAVEQAGLEHVSYRRWPFLPRRGWVVETHLFSEPLLSNMAAAAPSIRSLRNELVTDSFSRVAGLFLGRQGILYRPDPVYAGPDIPNNSAFPRTEAERVKTLMKSRRMEEVTPRSERELMELRATLGSFATKVGLDDLPSLTGQ